MSACIHLPEFIKSQDGLPVIRIDLENAFDAKAPSLRLDDRGQPEPGEFVVWLRL